MRHTVQVMFSQGFAAPVLELSRYILKNESNGESGFCKALLYSKGEDGSASIQAVKRSEVDPNKFDSGIQSKFNVELSEALQSPANELKESVAAFFRNLKSSTITLDNPGDYKQLHLCLYVPVYDREIWLWAKELIEIIKSDNSSYQSHIEIIAIYSDLAKLFCCDDKLAAEVEKRSAELIKISNNTIKEIIDYRNSTGPDIMHFFVLQNVSNKGLSLNLNPVSFIRVIGEFTLLCIERYHDIFGVGRGEGDLQGFGLSMISLDSYYFIEYLLTNVYLYTMEKEGIAQEKVDVNMAINRAHELATKWYDHMERSFKEQMKPMLDKGEKEDAVVQHTAKYIEEKHAEMLEDFTAFIKEEELSIPEKKAILAAILSDDDSLFKNDIYSKDSLALADLDDQPLNAFILENNKILETDDSDLIPKAKLSPDQEPAFNPLAQIKQIKTKLRNSKNYERLLCEEVEVLKSQIEHREQSQKFLIQGGIFSYGQEKFRLLGDDIGEALENDYVPHKVSSPAVDLRSGFTKIKNQGQQGSCLAFAVTSIYEYFLKSNNDPNPDLSEAFIYYNARKKAGKVDSDSGSRVDYAMESLVEEGICTEEVFPYTDKIYDLCPPQEAYDDAKTRKVKVALNVTCDVEAIKSALEDGFPVLGSFTVFNSFDKNSNGIISLPTAEELADMEKGMHEKHGYHAMVICGYSDNYKFFIVRNSWDTSFGDNGYCYIPYSYIADKTLFRRASAITEIDNYGVQFAREYNTELNFGQRDAAFMLLLNETLIEEQRQEQAHMMKEYDALQAYYTVLKQKLKDKETQDQIVEGAIGRLNKVIDEKQTAQREKETEKQEKLNEMKSKFVKGCIIIGLIAVALFVIAFILRGVANGLFSGDSSVSEAMYSLFKKGGFTMIILGVLTIVAGALIYVPIKLRDQKVVKQEYDDYLIRVGMEIADLKRELKTKKLTLYLAGLIMPRLYDLSSKMQKMYSAINSFYINLRQWYKEEQEAKREMRAISQSPLITILDNDVLDNFFEKRKSDLVKDIYLWKFILNYDISDDGIIKFKQALKEDVESNISKPLASFSLYKYLSKQEEYPYLSPVDRDVRSRLEEMDDKAEIFLQCNDSLGAVKAQKILMTNTIDDINSREFAKIYNSSFAVQPIFYQISSSCKMVLITIKNLKYEQVNIHNK